MHKDPRQDPIAIWIMVVISLCAVKIGATNFAWAVETLENIFVPSQPEER